MFQELERRLTYESDLEALLFQLSPQNVASSTSVKPIPVFSAQGSVVPRKIRNDYSVESETLSRNIPRQKSKLYPRTSVLMELKST